MKRVEAIVAVAMALSLSGCVLRAKPKTVSAPPAPPKTVPSPTSVAPPKDLSDPQTRVELPPPQPLSADALASTQPLEEAPSTPAPRPKPPRSGSGRTVASQRTETVGPSAPPAANPPAQPPLTEPPRPPIEVIVPQAELNRLQAEAAKTKEEIRQRLEQARKHRLSPKAQKSREEALSFVNLSDQAEKKGDMRLANELAARGLVKAKELTDGR